MRRKLWVGISGAALALLLLTGACALWCARHYAVRTSYGVAVLNKRFYTFHDTFMDCRKWTSRDFDARPEIKRSLAAQGYGDLLADVKTAECKAKARDLVNDMKEKMSQARKAIRDKLDKWLDE